MHLKADKNYDKFILILPAVNAGSCDEHKEQCRGAAQLHLAANGQAPLLQSRFAAWLLSGGFWHTEHHLPAPKGFERQFLFLPTEASWVSVSLSGRPTRQERGSLCSSVWWTGMTLRLGLDLLLSPRPSQHHRKESVPGRPALALAYIHKMVIPTLGPAAGHGLPCLLSCLQPQGCLGSSPGGVKLRETFFVNSSQGAARFPFLRVRRKWYKNSPVASHCCIRACLWKSSWQTKQ